MSGAVLDRTERLRLARPTLADLDELHAIYSDPRVWGHYPSQCHTKTTQTQTLLTRWTEDWDARKP